MNALELKIVPVAVVLIFAFAMWLAADLSPSLAFALPWRVAICSALVIAGGLLAESGILVFRKAKTTVDPRKPDTVSALVTGDIYHYSRNPMYFGLLLVLSGWATYLSHALPFLFLPLFVAYMNRFQITPEERALSAKFGAEFSAYVQSVRRWI